MNARKPKKNLHNIVHNLSAQAHIKRLSHDGRGIATVDGKITFVFGALNDETVRFNYQRTHKRFDEGQALSVLANPNPDRCQPQCTHFMQCGGCQQQHLNPTAQIKHKQAMLAELFQQQGIAIPHWLPPLRGPAWEYRRKARLSVKYVAKQQKVLVGFCERMSHKVAEINQCHILHPSIGKKLQVLAELLYQLDIRDQIPQIEVIAAQPATALVIRHLRAFSPQDLVKLQQFALEHEFLIFLQASGLDSGVTLLNDDDPHSPQHDHSLLYYRLPAYNLTLYVGPLQFIQVNDLINQQMIAQALKLLSIQTNDRVLDLFCGIGNFSLPIATQAAHVTGVEMDSSAVWQAYYNASQNKLKNCDFYNANLATPPWKQAWAQQRYNKILLDPPRTGAAEICATITQWQAQSIVYISCNPSTLVRDAAILQSKGYKLHTLGAVDMFPQTKHIEAIALFQIP